jgi:putative membrane protein
MTQFLIRWLVTTIAVAVAVQLTGMKCESLGALIGTALFLGILNALVRPVVLLLSLPFIVVTLGFFILIVNAVMLSIAGGIIPGFYVGGFGQAMIGALIISVVSWLLSLFFRASDGRYHVITHHTDVKRVQGRVVE